MKATVLISLILMSSIYCSRTVAFKFPKSCNDKYLSANIDTLIIKVKKKDFDDEIIPACQGWQERIKCGSLNIENEWSKVNKKKIYWWETYKGGMMTDVKKGISDLNLQFVTPFELIGFVMTKQELNKEYITFLNKDVSIAAMFLGTHIRYKVIGPEVYYAPGCRFVCKE